MKLTLFPYLSGQKRSGSTVIQLIMLFLSENVHTIISGSLLYYIYFFTSFFSLKSLC